MKKIGGTVWLEEQEQEAGDTADKGPKWPFSRSHKNQSIWNFDTRFSASCSLRRDLAVALVWHRLEACIMLKNDAENGARCCGIYTLPRAVSPF